MGGSFSIKSVLPALFPDDDELNYHNLNPLVQNGGHAMTIFPKIKDMPADEAHPNRLSGRLCKALSMGALDSPSD